MQLNKLHIIAVIVLIALQYVPTAFAGGKTVEVIGSGGGIRAALGFSGVLAKLDQLHTDFFRDNVANVKGISGGTWGMYLYLAATKAIEDERIRRAGAKAVAEAAHAVYVAPGALPNKRDYIVNSLAYLFERINDGGGREQYYWGADQVNPAYYFSHWRKEIGADIIDPVREVNRFLNFGDLPKQPQEFHFNYIQYLWARKRLAQVTSDCAHEYFCNVVLPSAGNDNFRRDCVHVRNPAIAAEALDADDVRQLKTLEVLSVCSSAVAATGAAYETSEIVSYAKHDGATPHDRATEALGPLPAGAYFAVSNKVADSGIVNNLPYEPKSPIAVNKIMAFEYSGYSSFYGIGDPFLQTFMHIKRDATNAGKHFHVVSWRVDHGALVGDTPGISDARRRDANGHDDYNYVLHTIAVTNDGVALGNANCERFYYIYPFYGRNRRNALAADYPTISISGPKVYDRNEFNQYVIEYDGGLTDNLALIVDAVQTKTCLQMKTNAHILPYAEFTTNTNYYVFERDIKAEAMEAVSNAGTSIWNRVSGFFGGGGFLEEEAFIRHGVKEKCPCPDLLLEYSVVEVVAIMNGLRDVKNLKEPKAEVLTAMSAIAEVDIRAKFGDLSTKLAKLPPHVQYAYMAKILEAKSLANTVLTGNLGAPLAHILEPDPDQNTVKVDNVRKQEFINVFELPPEKQVSVQMLDNMLPDKTPWKKLADAVRQYRDHPGALKRKILGSTKKGTEKVPEKATDKPKGAGRI